MATATLYPPPPVGETSPSLRERVLGSLVAAEREVTQRREVALNVYRNRQVKALVDTAKTALRVTIDPTAITFPEGTSYAVAMVDDVILGLDGFTFMAFTGCTECGGVWPGAEIADKERPELDLAVFLASGNDKCVCATCREGGAA